MTDILRRLIAEESCHEVIAWLRIDKITEYEFSVWRKVFYKLMKKKLCIHCWWGATLFTKICTELLAKFGQQHVRAIHTTGHFRNIDHNVVNICSRNTHLLCFTHTYLELWSIDSRIFLISSLFVYFPFNISWANMKCVHILNSKDLIHYGNGLCLITAVDTSFIPILCI